jgi:hypothetical protein
MNTAGQSHREDDLPAVISTAGHKHWHRNGKFCRPSGLHTVEYPDGARLWNNADGAKSTIAENLPIVT